MTYHWSEKLREFWKLEKAPINVGMAAGAAVAVTLVVIGIAAGGYFYYTKYGFAAPSGGGFSNPVA